MSAPTSPLALALALALAACNAKPPPEGTHEAPADSAALKLPVPPSSSLSAVRVAAEKGLTPPYVDAPAPASADTLPLIVLTKTELFVGEQRVADVQPGPLGFAAEIKRQQQRSALQVMALDAALRPIRAAAPTQTSVRILLDATTPYRSALETVFTAAQTGFTRFHFAVASHGAERTVFTNTPTREEWEAAHTPGAPQPPSFLLQQDGITITVGEVPLGTGCVLGGTGVTIPPHDGVLDPGLVAACAAKIKTMKPEWGALAAANLTAAPGLQMQAVLPVVAVIEATFPSVHFGMLSQ